MIELSGIRKSYKEHIALQNIDLFIQENEIFGIIGKSGAGKSTLLRCINRLEQPDAGQIIIDGEDITHISGKSLRHARHKIGMIFQHFNLLNSKTVYDNIALPMRIQGFNEQEIKRKIEELLPLVELTEKAQAYPSELSGGQKQRVAIARALSVSPKILLCDEATSALDPKTTEAILQLLQKINQLYGITIVLITHEMNIIKQICHRLAVIDAGRLTEVLSLSQAVQDKYSAAHTMLFANLSPKLPECLSQRLTETISHKPVIKLYFEGTETTTPFISQTSRELHIDINILLANVDQFESITCGVLIAQLTAGPELLEQFLKCCEKAQLSVEVLGYVHDDVL